MKKVLLLLLVASPCLLAQVQVLATIQATGWSGTAVGGSAPVEGAPFSATINTKFIQILADGNRIVQTSTGSIARDSLGRTRQELLPPSAGSAGPKAPRLALIQDVVSHTAYSLDVADKIAHEMPLPSAPEGGDSPQGPEVGGLAVRIGPDRLGLSAAPVLAQALVGPQVALVANQQDQMSTESLGSQTMQGLLVNGTRTTTTVPAGQIGNSEPIKIVNEVWTSPDLKIVIYSTQKDPLSGEQTFELTNIVRTEPDPSLFIVPPDFKIAKGPTAIADRANQ